MDINKIRGKAVRLAHENPALREKLLPLVKQATGKRVLTAAQRRDLIEAIGLHEHLVNGATLPKVNIDSLPGMSKMQFGQYLDKLAKMEQDLKEMEREAEHAIKAIKDKDKEVQAGRALLEKAAKELNQKAILCGESADTLIEIKSYFTAKKPGIVQMIASPDDTKWGDKAGDLFGRIAAKLGQEVAAEVQTLYTQCEDDLTHMAHTVKVAKLVAKTASVPEAIAKNAGILDTLGAVKNWFRGQKDALAQRAIQFAGTIKQWYDGFVKRTSIAKKAEGELKKSADSAMKQFDKLLAG